MKLQNKLFVYTLPLYLLVVVLMTALSQYIVRTIVEQGEYNRGLGVGLSVGKNAEVISGFQTKAKNRLLPYLQALQEYTQALYVVALDQNGLVLAHTNVVEAGKTHTDSITLSILHIDGPTHRKLVVENQHVLDLTIPVQTSQVEEAEEFLLLGEEGQEGQTRLGTLRIGLPLGEVLATAERISDQVFWIITVGSTLALILGLVFLRRVLRPIHRLSAAAEHIGKGNLGEIVAVSSTDEIGDLAQRFNQMSQDLAETTVSVETLRESEERFRRLSDSASEGIFIHQGSGIVEANDVFARMLGYEKADDIIGMNGWKFVGRNGRRTVLEHIRAGDERPFEITLIDKDGAEIPVEVIGKSVPYDGQVVGVVAIRDIRERLEAVEARRQLERQLIQSERMASVGMVAAGIVHNLKNPLTGVMGFAELLKLRNPDLIEAERIVSSAQQMKTMIENILSKSRQKMTPEPVDFNQLLERELDFLRADSTFKHEVETDIHLADQLPNVLCVYTEMSQVFGNLLRNAVESMHDLSKKVLCVTSSYVKERVVIEISDTGSGIKEEHLDYLFDPFFTTKTGEGKDEPQGTGLGLYMVKQMLDDYGATISVDSKVDVGTTFRVMLPTSKNAFGVEEKSD